MIVQKNEQDEWVKIEVPTYHCKECGEELVHRLPLYWKCYKCKIWFDINEVNEIK